MDLLGFFQRKYLFFEIKIRLTPPPNQTQSHGIPGSWVRLGTLRPARGWLAIGRRMGSGWVPCGPARCRRACGLGRERLAAANPGGLAVATPACGHPCTAQSCVCVSDTRCSTKCLQGRRRRGMTSPATSPTAPGRPANTRRLLGTPLGSWARRAQGRELVTVAVRMAPVRARRRRHGVGVGSNLPVRGRAIRGRYGVREAAHAQGGYQ
jgi:hypothetical protein